MAKKSAPPEPATPIATTAVAWAAIVVAAVALWFAWSATQKLETIQADTATKLTAMDAKVGEAVQEFRSDGTRRPRRRASRPSRSRGS